MRIAGDYRLAARQEDVWPLLFDPDTLMRLIPGCQGLEQIGPDDYRGQIDIRLPGISGNYDVSVQLMERNEPHDCRMAGTVDGPAGVIDGEAAFGLEAIDGETRVSYEATALISGALAKLNARLVEGFAKSLIQQGLVALDKQLQAEVSSP